MLHMNESRIEYRDCETKRREHLLSWDKRVVPWQTTCVPMNYSRHTYQCVMAHLQKPHGSGNVTVRRRDKEAKRRRGEEAKRRRGEEAKRRRSKEAKRQRGETAKRLYTLKIDVCTLKRATQMSSGYTQKSPRYTQKTLYTPKRALHTFKRALQM